MDKPRLSTSHGQFPPRTFIREPSEDDIDNWFSISNPHPTSHLKVTNPTLEDKFVTEIVKRVDAVKIAEENVGTSLAKKVIMRATKMPMKVPEACVDHRGDKALPTICRLCKRRREANEAFFGKEN